MTDIQLFQKFGFFVRHLIKLTKRFKIKETSVSSSQFVFYVSRGIHHYRIEITETISLD